MPLNRGTLARVDAKLRSEMEHDEQIHLVKVPVSEAVWSTWRRYCDGAGVSMGRGLAILMHQELASIVDEHLEDVGDTLAAREAAIVSGESKLSEAAEDVRVREVEVGLRELRLAEHQDETPNAPLADWARPTPGRNDKCWCRSGKKYKFCHGKSQNS